MQAGSLCARVCLHSHVDFKSGKKQFENAQDRDCASAVLRYQHLLLQCPPPVGPAEVPIASDMKADHKVQATSGCSALSSAKVW